MYKGVVIELKKDYSIVLADRQFYRVTNKVGMEEGQKIMFTEEDIFIRKPVLATRNIYIFAGMVASFITIVMLIYQTNFSNYGVYAIATVDINPSVELKLDKDYKVIKETRLNKDAEVLGEMEIMGRDIENAIEIVVAKAEEKGFIDGNQDAYVLVTTIPLKENQLQIGEETKTRINAKVKESIVLQNVNIATIQTTKAVYDEAVEKNIPVGICTLKGKIDMEKYNSVKEFFKVKENLDLFEEAGDIITSKKAEVSEQNTGSNSPKEVNIEKNVDKKDSEAKAINENIVSVVNKDKIKGNNTEEAISIKNIESGEKLKVDEDIITSREKENNENKKEGEIKQEEEISDVIGENNENINDSGAQESQGNSSNSENADNENKESDVLKETTDETVEGAAVDTSTETIDETSTDEDSNNGSRTENESNSSSSKKGSNKNN
ncbi:MAG TPA: hypothetical protein DEP72_09445 [Clostridiales bacterium]|nr:MAG: hypothetical protein A2Y18_04055 [Clostridiales bacterium GWD2_32_19]HCC08365.1 hypothetical protein [Clostridiales bacterium]